MDTLTEPRQEMVKGISIGRIRKDQDGTVAKKVTSLVIVEDDGTRHQLKDGKIVACKRPGENWRYFLG